MAMALVLSCQFSHPTPTNMPITYRVCEGSGLQSGHQGRLATPQEKADYIRYLEKEDRYSLHLVRDGWVVYVADRKVYMSGRVDIFPAPKTDCIPRNRLIEVK